LELAEKQFLEKCVQDEKKLSAGRRIKLKIKGLRSREYCVKIWTSFSAAYASGNWDTDFFQKHPALSFAAKKDAALFWSGTRDIAHDKTWFPKQTTLEDTPGGKLFDGLKGLNFFTPTVEKVGESKNQEEIEAKKMRTAHNSFGFWLGASARFAQGASGSVLVLLGGADPFRKGSIFRMKEFGALLMNPKVTKIIIRVMKPDTDDATVKKYFTEDGWILAMKQLVSAANEAGKKKGKTVVLEEYEVPEKIQEYCKGHPKSLLCESLVPGPCVASAKKAVCVTWSGKLKKFADRMKL